MNTLFSGVRGDRPPPQWEPAAPPRGAGRTDRRFSAVRVRMPRGVLVTRESDTGGAGRGSGRTAALSRMARGEVRGCA